MEKIIAKIKKDSRLIFGNVLIGSALVLLLSLLVANVCAAVETYRNGGWTASVSRQCLYALCNAGWIFIGRTYLKQRLLLETAACIIKTQRELIDDIMGVMIGHIIPAQPDGGSDSPDSDSSDGSSSDDGGSSDGSSSDDGGSSDDSSSDGSSSDGSSSDDGGSSDDSSSDISSSSSFSDDGIWNGMKPA